MADDRYAFMVEWYEEMAARTRTFQFFYFSSSKSIEMYDIKTRKMFLKTNLTACNICLQDLYIGASINVLGRQLKIVDFGDDFTKRKLVCKLEKTLGFIKPDVCDKLGDVVDAIAERGLLISKLRLCIMDQNSASNFYAEHRGKSFMRDLLVYVTQGPVIAFELVGENAISRWRELIGPTDPSKARAEASTSLRARFGTDVTHNGFHGSDSPASAAREVEFFFPSSGRNPLPNCVCGSNSTCAIIKPHAMKAGIAGKIINAINDAGFKVNTIEQFDLEKANVEEFYEVYKGVLHEYPAMVNELCSGPVLVMEVSAQDGKANVAEAFREACGPMDPEIARHLRPRTLRALFGLTKVQNAIHCTDLVEDAPLEVEYFFKILDR
ncbi:hypothetical protein EGW08_023016 [Elysia chlorotica]|uniref:Nucleoside diphosphate kinase n=1 Tax=Elysia chlorotica TaxID=188477 RepID=A0A433SJI7_ELYCH|nr:hypothetical protein EGW08_023016 [Elysia chlorotica]